MTVNLEQLRREYQSQGLSLQQLKQDPIEQFQVWLQQAIDAEIYDPTAMVVATVAPDGQPSQRIVLLKQLDQRGFVFYTNYESRKASEIASNAKISLHFPWQSMDRQVRVSGTAEKIPTAETLKYFLSRPRNSQIAASVSDQSRTLQSRQWLMQQFNSMKEKLQNKEVPLPDFWGGYRISPHEMEFWQGRENRLHDRYRYLLDDSGQWSIEQLAP